MTPQLRLPLPGSLPLLERKTGLHLMCLWFRVCCISLDYTLIKTGTFVHFSFFLVPKVIKFFF